MNLKLISFWLILFLSLPITVSAQQAIKADILSLEKRIQALDTRVSNLEITVKEMDKRLTNKIDEMDKRLTTQIQAVNARIDELDKHLSTIINILIGVVLAAIALPQVLGYLQGRRERKEIQNQIRQLADRIEHQQREIFEKLIQQQQEIETLRSRWLTSS